jgi:hypothetical protein
MAGLGRKPGLPKYRERDEMGVSNEMRGLVSEARSERVRNVKKNKAEKADITMSS